MIVDSVQIVSDWLGRNDLARVGGINAALTSRYPDTALVKGIFDVTRDRRVAENKEPIDVPAIYITPSTDIILDGNANAGIRDGLSVLIDVRYVIGKYNAQESVVEAYNTLHAMQLSLDALSTAPQSSREQNGIQIVSFNSLTANIVEGNIGKNRVTGLLEIDMFVRDRAARQ